ncbi:MAG: 50S ribosomal protein L22 [Candidatus Dormibacteria bacterium]
MEVVATAKWVRTTARKARLVTASVEGLPVAEALVILRFMPRAAARDVASVIRSAAANAEHNYNLDASTLRVARVEVEAAAIIKRFRPKPRGMSGSIFKRTAHLRAFVTDEVPGEERRRRSVVRMPRALVTAPSAGPSRETPAARRRRDRGAEPAGNRASRRHPSAATAEAPTPEQETPEEATSEEVTATEESTPVEDAAGAEEPTSTATETPSADAGKGETE